MHWAGDVYPSMHWAGGCLPKREGVSAMGGVYPGGGGVCPRECLPGGVYPSMHWAGGVCPKKRVSAEGDVYPGVYPSMHWGTH